MSSTITSPAPAISNSDSLPAPRTLPSAGQVFMSLFKADLTTQWRNRRASMMVVLLPIAIVMSWKPMIFKTGGAFVLANGVTLGLMSLGLMGYPNTVARDRGKEIFQRLRVTPAPSWTIMGSRIAVQIVMIIIATVICMVVGYQFDHISLAPLGYFTGVLAAIVGGAVYLALGQAIVGYISNAETVTATCRFVYLVLIMVGMFSELHALGDFMYKAIKYTPYGTVETIMSDAYTPSRWNSDSTLALALTLGYTAIFAYGGIRWFKWSTKS